MGGRRSRCDHFMLHVTTCLDRGKKMKKEEEMRKEEESTLERGEGDYRENLKVQMGSQAKRD
jgi:hypothetical protein